MPRIRKDVWTLGSTGQTWNDTLLWYAKAVGDLQTRKLDDLTSWWSLGAIHGISPEIWTKFGYLTATTKLPSQAVQDKFWRQCQHQTWYFLPWHRGYLAAFETIIRDSIRRQGGPADWALPYWNYSKDAQSLRFPPAFAEKKLPDGADNPLFTPRRYGRGDGTIVIDPRDVLLGALSERYYTGRGPNGATGFGGLKTGFRHSARDEDPNQNYNGQLESRPHNIIHVRVGGAAGPGDVFKLGLMTNPDTAGLDPIFWLHHANIDRLWKVWLRQKPPRAAPPDQFKDPVDVAWLDGPTAPVFVMPNADGTEKHFTARAMLDTAAPPLDYIYDDETAPAPKDNLLAARLEGLGISPERAGVLAGAIRMTPPKRAELVGANDATVHLNRTTVETKVRLDPQVRDELASTLRLEAAGDATREPDRVYLNLENIKSSTDAGVFYVYVNLPADAKPEDHPELFAGAVSLFGAHKATASDSTHGGNGISESLDITHIFDALHVNNALSTDLSVKLVSATPDGTDKVSIDRISVYRQGQE